MVSTIKSAEKSPMMCVTDVNTEREEQRGDDKISLGHSKSANHWSDS